MGMADEEALGIVGRGGVWLLDFDYCILTAGDDQTIRVLAVCGEVCDRIDELGAVGNNGALV